MSNQAAWIKTLKAPLLEVDSAPEAKPGPTEVVIKNECWGVAPIDWKIQKFGYSTGPNYPNILGKDIAGRIVEVGVEVTRLQVGQRVIAHALGRVTSDPKYGGFQLYSVAPEIVVSPIPDSLSFEKGVVLPLAITTAAIGLYEKDWLGVPYPTLDPKPIGKAILIWGGSSSVGSTTIQLAVASGLNIVTTASKKNFDYVKSMGAKHVFDHSSESVIEDIIAVLKGSDFVGAFDAISEPESLNPTAEIVHRLGGGKVAVVLVPSAEGLPSDVKALMISSFGITTDYAGVGDAIWRKYVPEALKEGKLLPKPDPIIIKGGLSSIQEGLDTLRNGVSAAKVVVSL